MTLLDAAEAFHSEISGFVLAGGGSSRLGRDKVLLPWQGGTLLGHTIGRLRQVCGSVNVCAGRSDLQAHIPKSMDVIPDAVSGAGPLGGMVAALERSQTDWNLFLAVDLPLVPVEFLQTLASCIRENGASARGALCVLPRVDQMPQPLCGLYHRSLAAGMRRALEEGRLKVLRALEYGVSEAQRHSAIPPVSAQKLVREDESKFKPAVSGRLEECVRYLDGESVSAFPGAIHPRERFLNINTATEWQRACDLASIET